jgi:hypothetical protein
LSPLRGIDWETLLRDAPSGFDVGTEDRTKLERAAGSGASTYGEILPASARRLLRWLDPGPGEVLFDLGSGSGRLPIQAVCETAVGRAVGVELSADRHAAARAAFALLRGALDADGRREIESRLEFRGEDLRATDLGDATIVYLASTSFPAELLAATCRRLERDAPRLRLIVTTRRLPPPWDRRFPPVGELDLDMSWTRAVRVLVHRAP